ncbi:MAG TPA: pilus assembly protein TadG-related protein, partial [Candidatus Sulfopaludibacter sp.]|nr:pilus assembly protein TadG-related protein [Candidatus Sulfopaludibacter sp.]
MLVIMVPVLFGLMGFAIDLGRLYLIRGELNQAANTMALAAAQQLLGTVNSLGNATTIAQTSLDNSNGAANTYNFGSIVIGQSSGNLSSTVNPPAFFASMADVVASAGGGATQADGTTARYVQVSVQADAPLLFFSLLPGGESRKTSVAAQAVAGISTPLCTACNIEPFAIANQDGTLADTVNFGLTVGQLYTFNFSCNGVQPNPVAGTLRMPYVFVNRYDTNNGNLDETQQLYRDFAGGMVASANPNPTGSAVPLACVGINDAAETLWVSAVPASCTLSAPASVHQALCGLQTRQDNTDPNGVCTTLVTDFTDLSAIYQPDTDVLTGQADDYTAYSGNGRRIFTVPVVDALASNITATMTVLGFRQFLLEPSDTTGTPLNPSQPNAQFVAMYIG